MSHNSDTVKELFDGKWLDQPSPEELGKMRAAQETQLRKFLQSQTEPKLKIASGVKQFATGATRSADEGKNDYEGFFHPSVIEFYGDYMTKHRVQPDGSLRSSDNWQKGIPQESYRKSLVRHTLELWAIWRGHIPARVRREMPGATRHEMFLATAGAVMFNINGLVFEYLRSDQLEDIGRAEGPTEVDPKSVYASVKPQMDKWVDGGSGLAPADPNWGSGGLFERAKPYQPPVFKAVDHDDTYQYRNG